jgi:hypothetical protein
MQTSSDSFCNGFSRPGYLRQTIILHPEATKSSNTTIKIKQITMKTNIELSKNLTLTGFDENNCQDGKLIAIACFFTFFGKEAEVLIVVKRLDQEEPRYAYTEITSELSASFNELLDEEEIWTKIVIEAKKYVEEWKLENAE